MSAFSEEYVIFIENLCSYLKDPPESAMQFCKDIGDMTFSDKIDEIEKEATSDYAQTSIEFASSQIDPSSSDRLLWEMKLFNASAKPTNTEEYKKLLNAGESVKGSLEGFLKQWLPSWLQRVLKILNQIISILKG